MSLFQRDLQGPSISEAIARPTSQRRGTVSVTNETALRHSAVWACLRLRANLISTLPVNAYKMIGGILVEVRKPPVLVQPGGERVGILEWMYSTQFDLDRAGNAFGLITARDRYNLPARIDLCSLTDVSVIVRSGELNGYRIGGQLYDPNQVWHEKQYTVAGMHVGLSPVAFSAWSVGEYLSIQDFALDWFGGGQIPAAELKNTKRNLEPGEAQKVKEFFRTSIGNGDLFVHGNDWEYNFIQAQQAGMEWLEAKKYGISDVARFFDCPGDLIDAAVTTGNITYANITQRNLQFLVMSLGPAITRREDALTKLTPRPLEVKINADALLRMSPELRAQTISQQIVSRYLTPGEARELEDRPPFDETQLEEFDRLFGAPRTTPTGAIS